MSNYILMWDCSSILHLIPIVLLFSIKCRVWWKLIALWLSKMFISLPIWWNENLFHTSQMKMRPIQASFFPLPSCLLPSALFRHYFIFHLTLQIYPSLFFPAIPPSSSIDYCRGHLGGDGWELLLNGRGARITPAPLTANEKLWMSVIYEIRV